MWRTADPQTRVRFSSPAPIVLAVNPQSLSYDCDYPKNNGVSALLAESAAGPVRKMKTPCELVVGKILPSLRAAVVKELSGKYHMKQSDIAKKLGITQASVSQYLSSTRAGGTKVTESFPKIKTYADEIATRIVQGEDKFRIYSVICSACKDIRSDEQFCKMHRLASNLEGCDICNKPE